MTPEQAAASIGTGDAVVVFSCGHFAVNPDRPGRKGQFYCAACGACRTIDYVLIRCVGCGRITRGRRFNRQFCADCYYANQKARQRALSGSEGRQEAAGQKTAPGELLDTVAAELGVTRQAVQQMEARACRIFGKRYGYAHRRRVPVYEGFVYLDRNLAFGPRSVTGADIEDAAAELMLDFWEDCREAGVSRPALSRVDMVVLPVTDALRAGSAA